MKTFTRGVVIALTLLFTLTLINCQQEDDLSDSNQAKDEKSPYIVNTLNISKIPAVIDFLGNTLNSKFTSKNTVLNDAIFEENVLEVIDTLNNVNYTFIFAYNDTPQGVFYNLVVGKTPEGENKTPYVLKYVCDDAYLDDFIAQKFNFNYFKGTVAIHKYTDFFEVGSFSRTGPCPPTLDENGEPISCVTDSVSGTDSGGGGNGDENTSTGSGDDGSNSDGSYGGSSGNCTWDVEPTCWCEGNLVGVHDHSPSVLVISCPPVVSRINATRVTDDCPECTTDTDGGVGILSGKPVTVLNNLLIENPLLLLEIDCNQIQNWQTLAQNTVPQSVQNKIDNLPSTFFNNFEIQSLEDANGTVINMDYFPIHITSLPNDPNTGQQFTADGFLDYFRRNMNTFASGGGTTFEPYCEISSMCQQETDLWNSNDPTGAIVYLNIPTDPGVVICSEYESNYWYFMTMNAPYAGNHPVSGTRQFGYEVNSDGSYNFFMRGVDRFNSFIQADVVQRFTDFDPYLAADVLWYSVQENMKNFVNANGGASTVPQEIKNRVNWQKVKKVLSGEDPVSDLGCN